MKIRRNKYFGWVILPYFSFSFIVRYCERLVHFYSIELIRMSSVEYERSPLTLNCSSNSQTLAASGCYLVVMFADWWDKLKVSGNRIGRKKEQPPPDWTHPEGMSNIDLRLQPSWLPPTQTIDSISELLISSQREKVLIFIPSIETSFLRSLCMLLTIDIASQWKLAFCVQKRHSDCSSALDQNGQHCVFPDINKSLR